MIDERPTHREDAYVPDERDDLLHAFIADVEVTPEQKKSSISPIPVLPELGLSLGLLALVLGVSVFDLKDEQTLAQDADVRVETRLEPVHAAAADISDPFEDARLVAEAAVVWDVKEQRMLFNKNGDRELPLASITKLMTALVTYELLSPEEKITISAYDLKTQGDSGLLVGEAFTMQDLLDLTLITSSNDGAVALGARVADAIDPSRDPEALFTAAMNLKAEEIGLKRTRFMNSTGLDLSPEEAGAYGTARDVALLMEHIILTVPNAVALTSLDVTHINNTGGTYHLAENTNSIVKQIPGLIASKTGTTDLAGGNLVIAYNAGLDHPIIISVLGSTPSRRFDDMLTLVEMTETYLSAHQ